MRTHSRVGAVLIFALVAASGLAAAPPASAIVTTCDSHFAGRGGGTGTPTDPYQVEDADDLDKVRDCLWASFRQTDHIDLSGTPSWRPIGDDYDFPFTGTFDGGGFDIIDLTIPLSVNDALNVHVGLFGRAIGATFTGINIISGSVTGRSYVGGLVGEALDTSITNSSSFVPVTGEDYVGGLIGGIGAYAPEAYAHGVCNVFSSGDVTATVRNAGGLAGDVFQMNIADVYASGEVEGDYRVGGLLGEYSDSVLLRAYARGGVTGSDTFGGVAGYVIFSGQAAISGVTWDWETTGQSDSRDLPGITSKTTDEMNDILTYQDLGWSIDSSLDANTTWVITEGVNDDYPYLASFDRPGVVAPNACTPGTPPAPSASAGDGSATITANQGVGLTRPSSLLIVASPGSGTCTINAASGSCTIAGLTNGTSYTFTATATNTVGTSTASAPSAAVTPRASGAGSTPTPTPSPSPALINAPAGPSLTVPAAPTFGIQRRPLAPGISAVTGEITTVTIPIRSAKPAGTSPSNAPRVSASVGQVIRVSIDGLASSQRVTTALQVESRWIRLGTSRTGVQGRTTLPAFETSVPGSYLMRIKGPETGTRYVWVDVR